MKEVFQYGWKKVRNYHADIVQNLCSNLEREVEVEKKRLIPSNQTVFRRRMGTLDNALNYLINRQVGMKGGKMVAVFVDLKAIFDR